MTARLDPEAKTGSPKLTTSANREKALRHGGEAMLAKKAENRHSAKRRSLVRNLYTSACSIGNSYAQHSFIIVVLEIDPEFIFGVLVVQEIIINFLF